MKQANRSSIPVILFAFSANLVIFVIKLVVSFVTRSSALLAEAVHSLADTLNQVLLIVGIFRARRKPDDLHPFGFSGELYFWSFIVAILLFSAGAVFSIYEGIHKITNPREMQNVFWAFLVLIAAIIAEGAAFLKALNRIRREKKERRIMEYLKFCKHSELIVVFMEDLAALCGLTMALVFILLQQITGLLILDGIASVLIGALLAVVAFFLARETHSLLIGEAADPRLIRRIASLLADPAVRRVIYIKSLQLGPEDILLGIKLEFDPGLKAPDISRFINRQEEKIRSSFPHVKGIFIEPDIFIPGRI